MSKTWQRVSRSEKQRFAFLSVCEERYVSPRTGGNVDAVVLDCADWVNVFALTADERIVMIRQFRFGTGTFTLEVPAGIVDVGEAPLDAARRELREETGYEAEVWTPLGKLAPNPAIMRNRLHVFFAEGARPIGEPALDPGEDIQVELLPLAELDHLIATNSVDHALVIAGAHRVALHRRER